MALCPVKAQFPNLSLQESAQASRENAGENHHYTFPRVSFFMILVLLVLIISEVVYIFKQMISKFILLFKNNSSQ